MRVRVLFCFVSLLVGVILGSSTFHTSVSSVSQGEHLNLVTYIMVNSTCMPHVEVPPLLY